MALLASAGLFARSLANVLRVDFGMRPEGVITFALSPELNGYDGVRSQALFARVREELAGLPGVTDVAFAMVPVVSNSSWGNDVGVEGYPADRDLDHNARYNEVAPGFFATLGVPLLSGREFTGTGRPRRTPRVAIVNQAFARKFGLGDHPVGKRLDRGNGRLDYEIVGLVQDAAYERVKDEVVAAFFIPALQDPSLGAVTFYARTSGDPAALVAAVPRVVQALEPTLPVEQFRTLPEQVRENTYLDHFLAILATTFALLATLLAALGLYGVLAYTVAQRTREFGVRMALGARPAEVRGLVLRQVGRLTLVGTALGLVGALALGRVAQALLYGMTGPDLMVLLGAALVLGGVALLAGFIPAVRAARLDPMRALRGE
ncbi:MAG: ABC transporter permease [Gemmatimonadetes bacterium]|nr:ABC transporter permease [Gemmatimonadota bacterium]